MKAGVVGIEVEAGVDVGTAVVVEGIGVVVADVIETGVVGVDIVGVEVGVVKRACPGVTVKVGFVLGVKIAVGAGVVTKEDVAEPRAVARENLVSEADSVEALVGTCIVVGDVESCDFVVGIVVEADTAVGADVFSTLNVVGRGVEVIADVVIGVSVEIAVAADVNADAVTSEDSPAVEKWSVLAKSGFMFVSASVENSGVVKAGGVEEMSVGKDFTEDTEVGIYIDVRLLVIGEAVVVPGADVEPKVVVVGTSVVRGADFVGRVIETEDLEGTDSLLETDVRIDDDEV